MLWHFNSSNLNSTFVFAIKNFKVTNFVMSIQIFEDYFICASMIFATNSSIVALNSMVFHLMSFKPYIASVVVDMSFPSIRTFNHLIRTVILNMIVHLASFYGLFAPVFAFDWSFHTFFDDMSVHFNQWELLSTV